MQNVKKGKNGKVPYIRGRILSLFEEYPGGLRASQIIKLLGLSSSTIYRHLASLQSQKLIENIYPIWQKWEGLEYPNKNGKLTHKDKTQLHNVSFVIKLIHKPHWWHKRNDKIVRLRGFDTREINTGRYIYSQLTKDEFIIQFHKYSLFIILGKNYWGRDPWACLEKAIKDFLAAYRFVENLFNFKFFKDGIPHATMRSQDYVNLRDVVAYQCKKTGDSFEVMIDGKRAMWVDFSDPLGVESNSPELMSRYQAHVKDIVLNQPPTNTQLAQDMGLILKAQQQTTEQLKRFTAILTPEPGKKKIRPKYIG